MNRYTGKVQWFSHDRQRGALSSIGGASLPFKSGAGEAGFTEGQLVSYADSGDEPLGPAATAVRPAAGMDA